MSVKDSEFKYFELVEKKIKISFRIIKENSVTTGACLEMKKIRNIIRR